jgi:hypothetical protein
MERGQTSCVRHARPPSLAACKEWTAVLKNDVTTSECGHKGRAKKDDPHVTSHTVCMKWLHAARLLQKLIILQPAKKFPASHRTQSFIIVFATARHLSVSWATSIQFALSRPVPLKNGRWQLPQLWQENN